MSAPSSTHQAELSTREQAAVHGSVLAEAPWKTALAAGAVVAGGDMLLHLVAFSLRIASPVALGVVAFCAVAGAGALIRARNSKAVRYARANPWRFAVLPGAAAAIIVFVLSMVVNGSVFGSVYTALWHGALTYGLTGLAGSVVRPRRSQGA